MLLDGSGGAGLTSTLSLLSAFAVVESTFGASVGFCGAAVDDDTVDEGVGVVTGVFVVLWVVGCVDDGGRMVVVVVDSSRLMQ